MQSDDDTSVYLDQVALKKKKMLLFEQMAFTTWNMPLDYYLEIAEDGR